MSRSPHPLRLAAIDLDGTLLAPDLTISAENHRALAQLQAAGLEVVLASGRHHTSIQRFAAALPPVRWIISAQGGEVSDVARTRVLSQTFLAPERVAAVRTVQQQVGLAAMFYTPHAILTEDTTAAELEFYRELTGLTPQRVPMAALLQASVYKIVWVAAPAVLDAIPADARVAALDVQQIRTHARLFEFMPTHVNKGTGLAALAQHLGLSAAQAVGFGDADNDIPMFQWAAMSFAMDHGWPRAKQHARQIAPPGPPESALARAVAVLLRDHAP